MPRPDPAVIAAAALQHRLERERAEVQARRLAAAAAATPEAEIEREAALSDKLAARLEKLRALGAAAPEIPPADPSEPRPPTPEELAAAALAEWEAMVPWEYRRSSIDHRHAPPHPKAGKLAIHPVLRAYFATWDHRSRRGTALVGMSGLGKTRVATLMLERARDAGMSVLWTSHFDLAEAGVAMHKPGTPARAAAAARDLLAKCCTRQWLYIDDVGKGATTERALAAFSRVAEVRTNSGLPIIWSAESGGKWLAARLGDDRGDSTIRRLGMDFCDAPDLPLSPIDENQR